MEALLTFVLGILSGLFLLGIIYAFYGVLKTQRELKKLKETLNYYEGKLKDQEVRLTKYREDLRRDMADLISDVRRQIDNRTEDLDKIIGSNNADTHQRIDEVNRYIDSRIDKTVGVLCTRMDTLLNDGLKAYHGIKEDELLKS
jgi:uncharacterized membrane-anchored protein YhcB (DUF1043 family)